MKEDHSMWAKFMLTATVREREGYASSRTNDLTRMLGGFKDSLIRFLDNKTDMYELEESAQRLIDRMNFIVDQARDLNEFRLKEREKRSDPAE